MAWCVLDVNYDVSLKVLTKQTWLGVPLTIFDENCGFSKPLFTKMAWCLFDGLFDAGTFQTTAKMVRSSNSHAIS